MVVAIPVRKRKAIEHGSYPRRGPWLDPSQLVIDEQTIERSTFQFADSDRLHPEGWRHLTRFQTSTTRFALWTWCGDRFEVSGTLHLVEAGMIGR